MRPQYQIIIFFNYISIFHFWKIDARAFCCISLSLSLALWFRSDQPVCYSSFFLSIHLLLLFICHFPLGLCPHHTICALAQNDYNYKMDLVRRLLLQLAIDDSAIRVTVVIFQSFEVAANHQYTCREWAACHLANFNRQSSAFWATSVISIPFYTAATSLLVLSKANSENVFPENCNFKIRPNEIEKSTRQCPLDGQYFHSQSS